MKWSGHRDKDKDKDIDKEKEEDTANMYIRINNENDYMAAVRLAYVSDWMFAFPGNVIPKWAEIKKNYHGNSKILLELYYNDITQKYEMSITTRAIELSYPQIKKVKPIAWDDITYDIMLEEFGEYVPTTERGMKR